MLGSTLFFVVAVRFASNDHALYKYNNVLRVISEHVIKNGSRYIEKGANFMEQKPKQLENSKQRAQTFS